MHALKTLHYIEDREAKARAILGADHSKADAEAEQRLAADIKEAQERLQPAA